MSRPFLPALRAAGVFCFVSLVLPPVLARALPPAKAITQYRRDVWLPKDGLPQSSVDSMVQTRDGYLWLGTQEGLARFDGVRFTVFDKKSVPEIRHNRILSLLEDRTGTLWIGTEGGGLARLKNGVFSSLTTRDGLPDGIATAMAEGPDGAVWIGTPRGLARFTWPDGKVRVFTTSDGLPSDSIRSLHRGIDGTLWVGTVNAGLARFRDGAFIPGISAGGGALPGNSVDSILDAGPRGLWVGTNHGLALVRDGRVVAAGDAPSGTPGSPVRSLCLDRDGSLWIGTNGEGLLRLSNGLLQRYGTREGLSDDLVGSLLEDREGNVWAGTQDGGLTRFANGAFTPLSVSEGLSHDVVWAIAQDRAGSIWLGTKEGGVNRLAADGTLTHFGIADGLSDTGVQAIFEDTDGAMWFGTRRGGLNRYAGGRFQAFRARDSDSGDGLASDSVSAVLRDRTGTLWIGTRGGGLHRMGSDGRVERVRDAGAPRPGSSILSIFQSRSGELYVGTNGDGLFRRDASGSGFRAFTEKDGLSLGIVNTIYEDERGSLWIGTYGGGLNRFRDGKFTAITTKEGLFDDAVFGLLEDAAGDFWISCNKGVYRVSKSDLDARADRGGAAHPLVCTAFGIADGLKSLECNGANQPPAMRSRDGRLWFPTVRGAVSVDPAHLPRNAQPPPVVIEQLLVNGESRDPRASLRLRPGSERFEISYTAPSFVAPERVRFRARLEGYEDDWVDMGSRRTAHYTHLPPGDYTFRVWAANDSGVWNENGAAMAFRLNPSFRQTPWFWFLGSVAIAGLVAGGVRFRLHRAGEREKELVALVGERTSQLELANRELKRLSTIDSLTGIANRRSFDEFLRLFWTQARRSRASISILMLDVDDFKRYNDAYGHLKGDEVLRRVADTISGAVSRTGDIVARFGGEEFAVLLLETPLAGAAVVAERMRARVEALAIPTPSGASEWVTVSVGGAAAIPEREAGPETLLALADQLLYAAKSDGKNRIAIAAEPLGME